MDMFRRHFPAFLVFALLFSVQPVLAEGSGEPLIVVSGTGAVDMAPDMAVLNLVVMREAPTAEEALSTSSDAMVKVMKAIIAQGITERDIQTTQFSIQPRYTREARSSGGTIETRKLIGYTVRNGLNVRVRDIDKVGEILDLTVRLGVNEGGSILFSNADPTAAIERARVDAVRDAMAKAQTLASAAGGKVGRVLNISEHSSGPRPMARSEMAMDSMGGSVPIAAGEATYSVSISMSVALEQ